MNTFILWTVFLSSSSYAARDAQYECGPHGRFEYCIDDIPGCVVGCHCHPGYYFDTDTKICEPNIKLSQDFRRHYLSQPARMQFTEATSLPETTAPTPTTINTIDNKIDEIANDADELGDWLYNQFFKTIENQVINKTKDDEHPLTRRSGNSPIKKKPKRKPRKFYKRASRKKKSKNKRNGLKRKLLRITEDDSLFDSDSSSSSRESSSSSSSESGSATSSEGDRNDNDNDHGHKKILIFNKKPKPSLPSFIFLPNIDTPYYPPLGLPPPPAVPMYPMVPVPPVASIYSLTGLVTPKCDEDLSNGATTASTNAGQSSKADTNSKSDARSNIASPVESITSTTTKTTTTTAATPSTMSTSSGASLLPNEQGNTPEEGGDDSNTTPKPNKRRGGHSNQEKNIWAKLRQGQQNKLLQKLRERMKSRNMFSQLSPIDEYQDLHEPFIDDNMVPEALTYLQKPEPNQIEDNVPVEDVDFKYLTQLIHRANLNNTNNKHLRNTQDRIEKVPPSGRRSFEGSYYTNINQPDASYAQRTGRRRFSPSQNEPEDAYYTNLGRQIASMIRKIDTNIGNREVDIEIEKTNQQTLNHPIFSENSYAPRNYWERSVRSPIKKYFPPYPNEFEYLKKSNEDLFNLENKVEIAASTVPSMSLHELENIVNVMENVQAKKQKQNNLKLTKESNTSFNINLLQKSETVPHVHDSKIVKINYEQKNNKYDNLQSHNMPTAIHNINTFQNFKPLIEAPTKKTQVFNGVPYNITRKTISDMSNDSALKFPIFTGKLQFIKNIKKPFMKVTKKPSYVFEFDPTVQRNQNPNYFTNNNKHYIYEKASFPYSPLFLTSNKPAELPVKSYFHHELHHFDYFDK